MQIKYGCTLHSLFIYLIHFIQCFTAHSFLLFCTKLTITTVILYIYRWSQIQSTKDSRENQSLQSSDHRETIYSRIQLRDPDLQSVQSPTQHALCSNAKTNRLSLKAISRLMGYMYLFILLCKIVHKVHK